MNNLDFEHEDILINNTNFDQPTLILIRVHKSFFRPNRPYKMIMTLNKGNVCSPNSRWVSREALSHLVENLGFKVCRNGKIVNTTI